MHDIRGEEQSEPRRKKEKMKVTIQKHGGLFNNKLSHW